ncbi:hypothetical protein AK812_SmicGene30711 [Symbiodinium microadriaticum]|uniref:Uncharacterized protein n=1 Tax=Symbiodinium microadriaticum TaxID=2951 RepID=A0A1Q9CYJ9_SYMMI|nr:hypothetical protein AK812_SmicGene30711 [Symbiodinium microadriaticum]
MTFSLVGAAEEAKHLHVIQKGFFDLLGWATLSEKESGFGELTRVLDGVPHRKRDLCNLLDNLISKGSAPCHELTVIRGMLQKEMRFHSRLIYELEVSAAVQGAMDLLKGRPGCSARNSLTLASLCS